jgi:hypothetical protein
MDDLGGRIPRRAEAVAWQRIDGELVLLQAAVGRLLGVNDLGALVWELVDGTRTVAEIITIIAREHPADAGRVAGDVEAYLRDLASERLVEWA